ncbi:MAG TPA: hypothetical protein VF755_14680 [Catenuloplanes sp.]
MVTGPPTAASPGRHGTGRGGPGALAALVVALLGAVALLVPAPSDRTPPAPVPVTAAQVWPAAQRGELPGSLPDGPAYSPVLFLDARASIGTAPSPDGTTLRLLLRNADATLRELRRLPMDRTPQYGGVTLADSQLAWAESVTDPKGRARTEVWAADLRSGAAPRRLATDTGAVAFFNSQYDMTVVDGQLYWVAVGPGDEPVTEVRSVPLTGGKVTVRTERGAWALSRWPWLTSAGSGQSGPVQLRDLQNRRDVTIDAAPSELVTCSPTWCRVLVLSGDGPARIDLMRPDGGDRQRMAGNTVTAAVIDVALHDRFEVLSQAGPVTAPASSQQLFVYDVTRRQTVDIAAGVGMVLCRAGVLWWSTGEDDALVWHTIDLRTV